MNATITPEIREGIKAIVRKYYGMPYSHMLGFGDVHHNYWWIPGDDLARIMQEAWEEIRQEREEGSKL